jgi:hypothetical protein
VFGKRVHKRLGERIRTFSTVVEIAAEMVYQDEMMERWSEILHQKMCLCGGGGGLDIAEKVRETRLRWYAHVIRRYKGELVRDIM